MKPLLVTVGLDDPLEEALRARLEARVVAYPALPAAYALDGRLYVESWRVAGRWLQPDGVVFYGYWPGADGLRRALALSDVPTFPDVRATLCHDDKITSLVLCLRADPGGLPVPRGYLPAGTEAEAEGTRVVKQGDLHCGEGKSRVTGPLAPGVPSLVEPFLEGTSERVLLVGDKVWQLRYDSDDWRKNVRATVTPVIPDPALVARARGTAAGLGLEVAGFDYQRTAAGDALLEVNAYPGLDDAPGAEEAFVDAVARWWQARCGGES